MGHTLLKIDSHLLTVAMAAGDVPVLGVRPEPWVAHVGIGQALEEFEHFAPPLVVSEGLFDFVDIGLPHGLQAVRAATERAAYLGTLRHRGGSLARSLCLLLRLSCDDRLGDGAGSASLRLLGELVGSAPGLSGYSGRVRLPCLP